MKKSKIKEQYIIENFELKDEIDQLKMKNRKLDKKNKHFQSSKAYKVWQKYANLKKPKTKNQELKQIDKIKVAFIADEFTYNSFKYEFKAVYITPKNWKSKFEKENIDIFFCESAWRGLKNSWRGKIYKKMKKNKENRTILFEIIEYCKQNNIPTIFWNKEDPPHYKNEKFSFADTARHFDYIFTSSDKCLEHYKKDFNHPNVNTLMFAGQPKLFNPLNLTDEKIDKIIFAGSYYPEFPERCELMDFIFDELIEDGQDMMIYDRSYYRAKHRNYPEKYIKYTVPTISHEETAEVYKKMQWGLNINTITDSSTMFARRIFELALTYNNIITNYSLGVDEIFGDNVFVFDRDESLPNFNNSYDEKKLNNLYNVLENHTYKKRWQQILDTIEFKYKDKKEDITIIFKLDENNSIDKIIDKFEAINYPDKLLYIITDSDNIDMNNYPQIKKIYTTSNKNYKKQMKKDIKSEFWIICDMTIDNDFIKHALLHYQYLNKRFSIFSSEDKFKISIENDLINKVISKKRLEYLNEDNLEIESYSI